MKFKETEIYKTGRFLEQMGLIMQNPHSTLQEMTEFAFMNGRELEFRVTPRPEPEEIEP